MIFHYYSLNYRKLQRTIAMSTSKESHQNRLKKTEPLKSKFKSNGLHSNKQTLKTQKNFHFKTTPVHKKINPNRHSTITVNNRKTQTFSRLKQDKKEQKKETLNSQIIINERSHSMSIVQQFKPSPDYQPLMYPKKTPIQNLQKIDIMSTVQNFFSRIMRPDNGCICDEPCKLAVKWLKWINVSELLVIETYQKLKQKVAKRLKSQKQDIKFFSSVEEEQLDHQIEKSFKQIRKDVERTQSDSQTFRSELFRKKLQNILRCYAIEDLQIGYVQGMNMILSGILYHVKDQAKSYAIFRKILFYARNLYLDQFRECYWHIERIEDLIKQHIFDVYMKISKLQIELHMICLPWILSLMASVVPLDSIHLIYDGFIKEKWNFIYRVCLSIFTYFKQRIRDAIEGSQVLMMLTVGQQEFKDLDWEDIVKYGKNIQINFCN